MGADQGFGQSFDYVIVGAGSAGCVLAHRLGARSHRPILVPEAGGSDRTPEVKIPAAFTKLFRTERDWAYQTHPQRELAGRELFWPGGGMGGGCTPMNAQMWLPGSRADYDGWEALGNPGWGWASVLEAFRRAERWMEPSPELHGTGGPCRVESQRDPNPATRRFLTACREQGLRPLSDLNAADNEGYGLTPVTQRKGRRWSAADAYLRPAQGRGNLTVITHAHVQRVLFEGRRARGVEYLDGASGPRRVEARREVLLCGGAVNSPQLLMLSGIGPAEHLRAQGLPVVCDRREVGANLQDHLMVAVISGWREPQTLVSAESASNLLRFLLRRKGMLTSNVGEGVAFIRTREALPAPDLGLIWAPVPFIDHGFVEPQGHGVSLATVLLQPKSRGRLQLRSASAADAPAIDPGYLSDSEDLSTLTEGVRWARRLLGSPALAGSLGAPIEPGAGTEGDAAVAGFIREQAETLYHPVGTCRMGGDAEAVVDPQLRVRGLYGLRVVDASVMPRIIRGHTHAPTVMIAERAAEYVLAA